MATCDACGNTILFGGTVQGGLRFCGEACSRSAPVLSRARQLSEADVRAFASQIHRGTCPRCRGPGPVDIHTSHQVWSALLLTRWKSTPLVACRRCGIKAQAGDLAISALAGWWGIPWGLLVTPVQVGRNLLGMVFAPKPNQPSPRLLGRARLLLAQQRLLAERGQPVG